MSTGSLLETTRLQLHARSGCSPLVQCKMMKTETDWTQRHQTTYGYHTEVTLLSRDFNPTKMGVRLVQSTRYSRITCLRHDHGHAQLHASTDIVNLHFCRCPDWRRRRVGLSGQAPAGEGGLVLLQRE